jgi:prophage regulatory protein
MHDDEVHQVPLKKLLRMRDLISEYGLSPATVYRWIGEGAFPLPVNIGSNSVAWHREEIEDWRRSRPRAAIKQSSVNPSSR